MMKKIKNSHILTEMKYRIIACLFCLVAAIPVSAQKKNTVVSPFGVNLAGADFGNAMPGIYGQDYEYPHLQDFKYLKSKGFSLVRLPFKWDRIQPQLNGALDKTELQRLKTVVGYALENDIQVVLDVHNYCRRNVNDQYLLIGDTGLGIINLADLWKRLATAFKDYKNIWGYGLMNEPHDMTALTPWAKIAQACIMEIRKIDSKTTIIVGGNNWSSARHWKKDSEALKNLYDPSDNLVFEAHLYFDKNGSGTYKGTYDEEEASPYVGIERVQPFVQWLRENNLRGFIGEYGVPDNDERWLVCLDNFLAYLQANGINGTYWAAGPRWGDYPLSVQPLNGHKKDRPQMKILQKYLNTK